MFVLIWATLLFAERSNNAHTAVPPGEEKSSGNRLCVLNEAEITAETGLCVVIPCYFTCDSRVTWEIVWYKCDPSKPNCNDSNIIIHSNTKPNIQSGFTGRVFLLESDVSLNNCSIIINDLTESDSGSYQLRVNNTVERLTSPIVNITVKALMQKPTVLIPPLTEGQQTTLTCTAPGLCSGPDPKITWTWRGAGEKASQITGNISAVKTENVTAVTQRHSSTLTFNPSAEHHGSSVTCEVIFTGNRTTEETVTLNVTYVKKPKITGSTAVKEGDALNLTCSVQNSPPVHITWTKLSANKNPQDEIKTDVQNKTLFIPNVTAEHSGQYICTAIYLNNSLTESINVTVKLYPKILNSSVCKNQSEVLTCVCISEGFPLPTITWPLLKNHTEYSVINTVSEHTVNSTITLTVKEHSSTSVECVSSNENGEVKRNLIRNKEENKEEEKEEDEKDKEEEGLVMKLLRTVSRLETIIAFFIGVLLAAVVCCLVRKCHRKKQPTYGSLTETLEMVSSPGNPVVDDDQAIDQEAAGVQGAVAAGKSDVEYSDLDFSRIKERSAPEAKITQAAAESEYAEIKKGEAGEKHDGEGKEEEEMIEEDKETKGCVAEEKEGEDVALYSNVKDVMDEI